MLLVMSGGTQGYGWFKFPGAASELRRLAKHALFLVASVFIFGFSTNHGERPAANWG
jgi:hypothetical protein